MSPAGHRLAATGWTAALTAAAVWAQPLPQLTETIEVRVVNVDVVVTDSEGLPIAGLGPEEFELRVDGEPVEIKYFTSIRDGHPMLRDGAGPPRRRAAEAGDDLEYRPYLAVLVDGRSLDTVGVEEMFEVLRQRIGRLADSTRGVLIARQGRSLRLDRGFTRQPEVLARSIDQLSAARTRAIDSSNRDLLLRRLDRAPAASANPDPDRPLEELRIEAEAMSFLQEIRTLALTGRSQNAAAMRELERFVGSLAGLPGRKCILYLGPGFNVSPGEVLLRVWWDKYWPLAPRLGVPSIESEIVKYRLEEDLVGLIEEASENNVAFYTFDPAGLRAFGFSTSLDTVLATAQMTSEDDLQRRTLLSLAGGTGGIGLVESNRLDLMLDRMTGDLRTYYSLGFEPAADAPDRGRIRVRMRHPAYRVRHLERFTVRGPERQLEERTMAALLTDEAVNPMAVGVELESGEKQQDGTWIVPILLKVPLSRVTLLPREATHVGRLRVVIIAQGEGGDLSDPAHGELPIEIDNAELLAAMNRLAGYRMRLRVRRGEQRLAIGVRDEITGEESTLNLVVDAGGPSR